ncbi:MAG TPA: M15 family metallopeptidase [Blastocatellia bacterium]
MLSVKASLSALRCLAVAICFSLLAPAGDGRSPAVSANSGGAATFGVAAERNARLMHELNWTFGGKPQRGWRLYTPLIQRLIGADAGPETSDFAEALARWQRTAGLAPTGTLDKETWMKMVAAFQSRRIKDRSAPPAGALTLASASKFFDPKRPEDLRYVERGAYEAYKKLVAAAAADLSLGPDSNWLKVISAYRSPAYQARLRKQNPRSGRAGLAVNSPHFTGRALDLYVGGDPVSTADQNRKIQVNTKVYQWLVKNAERYGFYPYFYEPWHWEYRPRHSEARISEARVSE